MQNKINFQETFLLRARREAVPVTMFLMNGIVPIKPAIHFQQRFAIAKERI